MTSKTSVETFIAQKTLALAGASRSGKKFGNSVLKELTDRGYTVYPVHPEAEEIDGQRCYASLKDLPEAVGGAVLVTKPTQTELLVRQAKEAGIPRVWMQKGAHSDDAVTFCRENGIDAVHDECILMFSDPVNGVHAFHRWLWKVFGKLPK